MNEKTLKSKQIYTCHFMTLYEDEVELHDGKFTNRVFIDHPGAAAVLALTPDEKIILTKQFRYPIKDISIEIPAGKKDKKNENPLSCAKRELEEETGYASNYMEHFIQFFTCLGYSNEVIDIYIARDCQKVINPKSQDEDENVEVMIVTCEEAKQMLENHTIKDAKTIMAIQKYLLLQQSK
jgi:ADP-ribose pyrophosphatase